MKKKLTALLAAVMLVTCISTTSLAVETTPTVEAPHTVPFPGGINVSLNGRFLSFDNVAPITADGMTMVPLRAFLESFGGYVGYEDGQVTAALPSGEKLAFDLESNGMTVTQNGEITTVDLGTAPFVLNRTTYLPARAIGEALGFRVTYESTSKTVYLTDWVALAEEIDKDFMLYNELLALSQAAIAGNYDLSKPLQGKVNFTASADVNTPVLQGKGDLSIAMTMLMDRLGMSMQIAPKLDMKDFVTAEDETGTALLAQMEAINECDIQTILNQKTGDTYFKTDLGARLGTDELDKDTWYQVPASVTSTDMAQIDALYDMMNAKELTIGNVLSWYYEFLGETMGSTNPLGGDPYVQVRQLADMMGAFFGDSVVSKKTVGATSTYSVDQGTLDLGFHLAKLGMVSQDDLAEMLISGTLPRVSFQMTATVKAEKLTNMDMNLSMKMTEDDTSMEMNLTSTGNVAKSDTKLDFTMKQGEEHISFTCQFDVQLEPTTKAVPIAPAAGEQILELE